MVIGAPPRSGGTALFRSLAQAPGIFSAEGPVLDGIFELEPENREWSSNRLTAADVETSLAIHGFRRDRRAWGLA